MAVEAKVVSSLDQTGGDIDWSMGATNYNYLRIPTDPGPVPFNTSSRVLNPGMSPDSLPDTGVMLSWALPYGLRQGTANPDGSTAYPLVPNRWLVVRMFTSPSNANSRELTSWIVQSDYSGTDGMTLVPSPNGVGQDVFIGKVWPLVGAGAWPGEQGDPQLYLTAGGPGDVAFAAFYPNSQCVFGMQDGLAALPGYQGYLTYLVTGWYSNPADDVLAGADAVDQDSWANTASTFNWSVGSEEDLDAAVVAAQQWLQQLGQPTGAPCPTQSLVHGMTYSVPWFGTDPPGGADSRLRVGQYIPPSNNSPEVYVGNTSAEALATVLSNKYLRLDVQNAPKLVQQLEFVMEAFQYNLLADLDGHDPQNRLQRGIQGAAFGRRPAGTLWAAVPSQSSSIGSKPPALTGPQADLLQQLNATQQQLDAATDLLASRQQLLYALYLQKNQSETGAVQTNIDDLNTQMTAWQAAVDPTQSSSLAGQLTASLGPDMDLITQTKPTWFRTSDPVLLLSGAGRSYTYDPPPGDPSDTGTALMYDPPGADPGDVLFCRFSGQTITSLGITGPGGTTVDFAEADLEAHGLLTPLTSPLVPPEVADLCVEAYLLDTENSAALAATAGPLVGDSDTTTLAQTIATQQTLVWNTASDPALDLQTLADAAGLNGTIPSLLSVAYWESPWTPLFLDWQVTWYPSGANSAANLAAWDFDAIDFIAQAAVGGPPQIFTARTVLTPNVTRTFRQQLANFVNPSNTQVGSLTWALGQEGFSSTLVGEIADNFNATLEAVENWDVLAQSLGGLTEMMVQISPGWAPSFPYGPAAEAYLDGAELAMVTSKFPYCPVRAGAFEVTGLSIVDSFGQSVVVTPIPTPLPSTRALTLTPPTAIDTNPSLIYLPPRLAAESRLLCNLLSADDDSQDVALYPGTSPLCGWLVPNCLDGALDVFDGHGELLGELFTTEGGAPQVQWVPAPASDHQPQRMANMSLKAVVNGLLTPGLDGGFALADLLASIDEGAWASAPRASTSLTNLTNLVGRPLALVRAEIALQFRGDPPCDQAQPAATLVSATVGGDAADLATVTHGLLDVEFTVHLGAPIDPADGLIGFFADKDLTGGTYPTFYSACPIPSTGDYVIQVPELPVSFTTSQLVVLVMDPFSSVLLTSGILPQVTVTVPVEPVNEALGAMTVAFRIGPLLTQPALLSVPVPSKITGRWEWRTESPPGVWHRHRHLGPADEQPNLTAGHTLLDEGWLVLSDALGAADVSAGDPAPSHTSDTEGEGP